jgi:hypothetical protein
MINQDMSIDVDFMDQLLRSSDLRELNSTNLNNVTPDVGIEIIHSENAFSSFDLDTSRRQVETFISILNEDECNSNNSNVHYIDLTMSSTDTEDDNDLHTLSNESGVIS